MRAILIKFSERKLSTHGGYYVRCHFKSIPENKSLLLDVYENHTASKRFIPYIKQQAVFDNLVIFKKNIISGNSNFTFLGIKQTNELG